MPGHHHALFTTLRNEGSLLPTDFLQRVANYDPNLAGLTPLAYHQHDDKLNEAITYSWNRLLRTWINFKLALSNTAPDDKTATTLTQERWLQQIFVELYYGQLPRAQPLEVDGKRYTISHHWNHTPIHLVSFKEKLDERRAQGRGHLYSPHNLVQQYVNYTGRHPWGIVSNGLRLRLLRKNMHMMHQSYLEFDLEAMMQGEVYADFVLFWLLCHQSRMENEHPEGCWLEQWSHLAQEEGIRAQDHHNKNVEKAIIALGKGFLACTSNQSLHKKLHSGILSDLDYYRQILRLVYRLIVLFVAEDREVLFHPASSEQIRKRYNDYYSTTRLRALADINAGTPHVDLFRGLNLIMEKLGHPDGCPELGLSPLNGFLFSKKAIPDLEGCDLANSDLLDAIRALAFTSDGKTRQRINYKHIGSEELGSIYEGLLELHPILNIEAKTFVLQKVKGNERKTTGSYYTHPDLVHCLLDSALEPVIRVALAKSDAEQALLHLKVCDPACGSGHFLVAAAHRIATRLAIIRAKDEEPTREEQRKAMRDVVGHCIYGVDINPMAVELCRVSLWMDSIEPGKPLSFLDHHILCGNSLIGTTPTLLQKGIPDGAFEPIEGDDKKICYAYKKLNKKFLEGNRTLFDPEGKIWRSLSNLTYDTIKLENMSDITVEDYHHKEETFLQTKTSSEYLSNRLLADTWCAAFVWKKTKELPYPITEEVLWKIKNDHCNIELWMKEEIGRLQEQYQFFHWYLEFPEVFSTPAKGDHIENERTGWFGGFDVVLGNPPWERIDLKEQEWFETRDTEIAESVGAERKKKIKELTVRNQGLHNDFMDALRQGDSWSHFIRNSGHYPLSGHGRINTYAVFTEINRLILKSDGQVGCIVQSGIATDMNNRYFFQDLIKAGSLVSLYDFDNTTHIFKDVDSRYKFCLLTMVGSDRRISQETEFAFFLHSPTELHENRHRFTLSLDDIALINPETLTCPVFRSQHDAELTKLIYRRVPVLMHHLSDEGTLETWDVLFDLNRFNMTSDSHLFYTRQQLISENRIDIDNVFRESEEVEKDEQDIALPLYEGKMLSIYDHRFNGYENQKSLSSEDSKSYHKDPSASLVSRYWVPKSYLSTTLFHKPKALIAFRDIARATDVRTIISTILPIYPCSDTLHTIVFHEGHSDRLAYLSSCLSSFVFDYFARQKINGTHVKPSNLRQLPILPLEQYKTHCQWDDRISLGRWILPRVLELTYTTWDLESFASDCCYNGSPFRWDEERRFLLCSELDAAYFHLYGIKRDDVDYIMETFPIIKKKDESRYGHFRTKRIILSCYDAMSRAIKASKPYKTNLTPSPADPSVAHPSRN